MSVGLEMRTEYTMQPHQMDDWNAICREYARQNNLELLFVNETSFGVQNPDGSFSHIYIDELVELLKNN